jgi:hypothetical protein
MTSHPLDESCTLARAVTTAVQDTFLYQDWKRSRGARPGCSKLASGSPFRLSCRLTGRPAAPFPLRFAQISVCTRPSVQMRIAPNALLYRDWQTKLQLVRLRSFCAFPLQRSQIRTAVPLQLVRPPSQQPNSPAAKARRRRFASDLQHCRGTCLGQPGVYNHRVLSDALTFSCPLTALHRDRVTCTHVFQGAPPSCSTVSTDQLSDGKR